MPRHDVVQGGVGLSFATWVNRLIEDLLGARLLLAVTGINVTHGLGSS